MKHSIPQPSKTTATIKGGYFHHFGIIPMTAMIYGDKVEDILDVEVTVAEDQTVPPTNPPSYDDADYWGFYDFNQGRFSLIYPQYFLLNMCFPSGVTAAEEVGRGKAFRLNVKKV